jgi:hypothetical protein
MGRLEEAYRLRVQARSLSLIARSVIAAARELVARTCVVRHESQALLERLRAMRLHGPLPRGGEYSSPRSHVRQ